MTKFQLLSLLFLTSFLTMYPIFDVYKVTIISINLRDQVKNASHFCSHSH